MGITLNKNSITAKKTYSGSGSYKITAGKSLKIETSPEGEEILEIEVPEGKVWTVSINLAIDEVDA